MRHLSTTPTVEQQDRRHAAAAFMIDDDADPLQLKRRMGHEDIRPSLDTYGHLVGPREGALGDALVSALLEQPNRKKVVEQRL